MTPKFYNKNGTLTDYALSCGYVETRPISFNGEKRLSKSHGVYHVIARNDDNGVYVMQSFHRLTNARKLFNAVM